MNEHEIERWVKMEKIKVGILLFNEVEVLDFAGPYEVFSIASYADSEEKLFAVSTIAEQKKLISARNGLQVMPDKSLADLKDDELDILIVPGGRGASEIEINNSKLIEWLKNQSQQVKIMASVCTGAFLLAKAGLLDGKEATTHWSAIERLQKDFPEVKVQSYIKYVDEGNIVTSAGVAAGIDMSLYLLKRLFDEDLASYTSRRMEFMGEF